MNDDDVVLICALLVDHESVIPGSTKDTCHDCGAEVAIAPSGRALQAKYAAIILCGSCGQASIEANPETAIAPPTKEQIQEIEDAMRREFL